MFKALKARLLQAGPDSALLALIFQVQAAVLGVRAHYAGNQIILTHGREKMLLKRADLISVPFVVHTWKGFFATFDAPVVEGKFLLDFSRPGLHRYRKSGLSFHFPAVAEDDSMAAYTASYMPQPGDVVWDVGAHAGMTSYFFSKMVGEGGRVYAFEPDETNVAFLQRNLASNGVTNVTVVKAALAGTSGTANFCMDGTMNAGLSAFLSFSATKRNVEVRTVSLEDACRELGSIPAYIKMDIEGGEVDAVRGAVHFLRNHPIHFAVESNHVLNGEYTSRPLERIFKEAGYKGWSTEEFGQLFTWAEPVHSPGEAMQPQERDQAVPAATSSLQ